MARPARHHLRAVALYLLAPLAIVIIISFSAAPFLQFPPPGLSLRWYQNLFSDANWVDSIIVSIEVLIPSSLIATLLGTAAAYALIRGRIPGATLITACLMLPVVVPGSAASLYGSFAPRPERHAHGSSSAILLITPYVSPPSAPRSARSMLAGGRGATLGAPPWAAFRRITLPLLCPAVLSGLLFAMVVSFDELVVSLFISPAPSGRSPCRCGPTSAAIRSDHRRDRSFCFVFSLLALLLEMAMRRRAGTQRS